jgi:glycosyltransferase involved in cell wall biosynthesis
VTPWLLVTGDFVASGGMDTANHALARHLARTSTDVHLVAHRAAGDLLAFPSIRFHRVPRPLGSHRLGEPLLRRAAGRWQRRLNARTIANGGNVDAGDVTWVHYVHAAFEPCAAGALNRARTSANHRRHVAQERRALQRARLVLCNSARTVEDVVMAVGVDRARTRLVYYGIDERRFSLVTAPARAAARGALGIADERPAVLFVGALGDRRKGFDTLFDAWEDLHGRPAWDGLLLVAGAGAELSAWRRRAAERLPAGSVRFLGYRDDMPDLLAACDLLVHPARYEAYGLAVHEALCRGVPAIVSASAGVAERYPADLSGLLLQDVESAEELSARLLAWRDDRSVRDRVGAFAAELRRRTWDDMAADIVRRAEECAPA